MGTDTEPGRTGAVGIPPTPARPDTDLPPTTDHPGAGDAPPLGRLYRSRLDRTVGGVCGGLGHYFRLDPAWFRVGFVVLALGGGSSLLLYLLLWVIVPEEPDDVEPTPPPVGSAPAGGVVIGLVLVAVGFALLVATIAPTIGRFFWPLLFLGAGLALIAGGRRRDH